MNKEEAKELADKIIASNPETKEILAKIKAAATNGEYSLPIAASRVGQPLAQYLRNLGYDVIPVHDTVRIYWM